MLWFSEDPISVALRDKYSIIIEIPIKQIDNNNISKFKSDNIIINLISKIKNTFNCLKSNEEYLIFITCLLLIILDFFIGLITIISTNKYDIVQCAEIIITSIKIIICFDISPGILVVLITILEYTHGNKNVNYLMLLPSFLQSVFNILIALNILFCFCVSDSTCIDFILKHTELRNLYIYQSLKSCFITCITMKFGLM